MGMLLLMYAGICGNQFKQHFTIVRSQFIFRRVNAFLNEAIQHNGHHR